MGESLAGKRAELVVVEVGNVDVGVVAAVGCSAVGCSFVRSFVVHLAVVVFVPLSSSLMV